ncbi:MAG: DMT family transporter [Gallionella sp.]|nr:DMT family transporter [Gallionella sp.]MDD4959615.1 DMT family transporter [Gallionella sp.]
MSFIVSLTFCIHFFVAKEVMTVVPPLVLGGVRGVLGGLLLFIIFFPNIKGSVKFSHFKILISIAFFGYFINQILFLNGLKLSTPLNTSVIMNLIPVTAALISILFRVETFAWRKIVGALLGFSMIVLLTLSNSKGHISGAKLGDLLIFASVVTLCISTVLTKTLVRTGFPSQIISASMLFLGGFALCAMATDQLGLIVDYAMASDLHFAQIVFEIVISTALTYFLSFKALKYLAPSQSMIFIYLQPLMTAGIDFMFFTKTPPIILIPVFIGVVYSSYLVFSAESH